MAKARKTFEGREVIGSEIAVSGAAADGDGVDPFQVGDVVFLVCEAVVQKVTHQSVKDSDKLIRHCAAKSLVGAVVDRDLVQDAIEMARMQQEAKEGIQRLGFDGDG